MLFSEKPKKGLDIRKRPATQEMLQNQVKVDVDSILASCRRRFPLLQPQICGFDFSFAACMNVCVVTLIIYPHLGHITSCFALKSLLVPFSFGEF